MAHMQYFDDAEIINPFDLMPIIPKPEFDRIWDSEDSDLAKRLIWVFVHMAYGAEEPLNHVHFCVFDTEKNKMQMWTLNRDEAGHLDLTST